MENDVDTAKRFDIRIYEIIINGFTVSVSAQSMNDAMMNVSKLRLNDDDVVIVKLAK